MEEENSKYELRNVTVHFEPQEMREAHNGVTTDNALEEQVGGAHYREMEFQPVEFIHGNGLGFIEGNIIKYACRHQAKGGAEDVRKIIHYAKLLLALEYGEEA